jgi:hypothetical protein
VDFLVTLAPFIQFPIPANVLRAMNFYQSPGWGALLTPGQLSNIDMNNDCRNPHQHRQKSQGPFGHHPRNRLPDGVRWQAGATDLSRSFRRERVALLGL